ncbi:tonB-system energizer ExbB [Hyphomicrobium sp.]|uniref:tonB-system energizer ExbB n=1 Tax=Hyphomicrobium sp. TaxID=82 RepID=UPI002E37F454|nr:tonB-system energizer ExbB [Hyphomicrobium sp.]HEX2840872.1 tonB-system energizer ExbB [Hyphomicrobium sp.]
MASTVAAAIMIAFTAFTPAVGQEAAGDPSAPTQAQAPHATPSATPVAPAESSSPSAQTVPLEPPASVPAAAPIAAPSDPAANTVPPQALTPLTDQAASPGAPDAAPELTNIPSAAPFAEGVAAPASGEQKNANLPHDLSPWNMFMSADIVVKAVMIGLAFASVVTWTVWLAKSLELTWAKRRLSRAYAEINASASLAEAAQRLRDRKGVVSGLIELAALELRLSVDTGDKSGIKERVSSRLDGLTAAAGRDMNRGTGVLATIGSTSPFVGLFGTVWGIMNSFIGISETQTTNLAVVAPGIAEALLATAIGLVAAIPAVIIYNQFARSISGYKASLADASAEVMRLVSRDLDRGFKIMPARAAE